MAEMKRAEEKLDAPLDAPLEHATMLTFRFHHASFPISTVNMPAPTNREEILVRLRESVSNGKAIVGAGAG